jgi:hypothetical protein
MNDRLSLSAVREVDAVCLRFEDAWQAGQRPRIEDFLDQVREVVMKWTPEWAPLEFAVLHSANNLADVLMLRGYQKG